MTRPGPALRVVLASQSPRRHDLLTLGAYGSKESTEADSYGTGYDINTDTRAVFHLQSCEWAADYYRPFFGDRIRVWTVGIETGLHRPRPDVAKEFDFLVYDKLRWPAEHPEPNVLARSLAELDSRGLKYQVIGYGRYPKGRENTYHSLLARSRAVLFLCENETQGIAYNEALDHVSLDVLVRNLYCRGWMWRSRNTPSAASRDPPSTPGAGGCVFSTLIP